MRSDASREPNWMVAMASTLVDGPMVDLGAVPRMTVGAAGVFTIWYRDPLLFVGHARNAAGEARPSNFGQADGARGRLAGVRRQPPVSVQRALGKFFAQEFKAAPGPNDQKRAAALLERHAKYRMVETSSGPEAVELFGFVQSWLTQQGYRVLADEAR